MSTVSQDSSHIIWEKLTKDENKKKKKSGGHLEHYQDPRTLFANNTHTTGRINIP